jgi:deoxyribodipyrimidine photo-lyase
LKHFDINTDAESLLGDVFEGLHSGGGRSSIPGGQTVANQALANLDIRGYAKKRSAVLPIRNRGASVLSPYIRHNILSLQTVWGAVSAAPEFDKEKLRDELLWQEYARHLHARIETRLFQNLRFEQNWDTPGDGWLVNQTRMWLASHWSVRTESASSSQIENLTAGLASLYRWSWINSAS